MKTRFCWLVAAALAALSAHSRRRQTGPRGRDLVTAMLAAQTMTGVDGIRAHALPGDWLVAALRKYNRMQ